MRDRQPIYRDPEHGFYVATRYNDVEAILQDLPDQAHVPRAAEQAETAITHQDIHAVKLANQAGIAVQGPQQGPGLLDIS